MAHKALTIGKLAAATGTSVETIRYYERIGLMPEPPRTASGYRLYSEHHVARLQFIRRARRLEFSLNEITDLLNERDGLSACDVRDLTEAKIRQLETEAARLLAARDQILRLMGNSDEESATAEGAFVAALDSSGDFAIS
jgi:MerR family mercuric resistance operon transcriptional regulator